MRALKHPRTMTEAFGPYTSNEIHETPAPFPWTSTWAIWAVLFALMAGGTALMPASAGFWFWVMLVIDWVIFSFAAGLFIGKVFSVGMGDDHA